MIAKRVRSKTFALLALILAFFALAVTAQNDPAPGEQGEKQASAGQSLLKQMKYGEALAALDLEIGKSPKNPDLHSAKLEALMGLDRYPEAAKMALGLTSKFPDRQEFRYILGECAFAMGQVQQAAQTWAALFKDPVWGAAAAARSARAMLAIGKEEQAKKTVADYLALNPDPPAGILRLWIRLNPTGPEGVKAAEALAKLDPANHEDYDSLKKLFAEAGPGSLFEEGAPPSGPVTIPIKEKSESVDFSSLSWGSTGSNSITTSTQVVIPISIQGSKDRWIILDSGANEMLVSPFVVKELGLTPLATAEYIGLGYKGAQKSNWVLLKEVKVGSLTFKNVPAKVIDKKADFWERTAGILPLSMLRKHALHYDRRHSKLVIYPSGTKPETVMGPATFTAKSLWFDGRPFVETELQGRKGSYFLLDAGGFTTYLSSQYIPGLGIRMNSAKYNSQKGIGLSGSYSAGVAQEVVIILGNTKFNMPTVQAMEISQDSDFNCYGILGRNILDIMAMFFDYQANVIAFKPYDK